MPERLDGVKNDDMVWQMTLEEARQHFRETKVFNLGQKVLQECSESDLALVDIPTLD